ncbi:branched-chain amino acid ABC transporter permease [Leucobacter sp. USHLN153]|uniref:branched-chain amino acid ABC transporter permease n=1 Tax=Leucobacter sp. USHLN153 TaxID=3081268 RepID=UPI00301B5A99
MLDGIVSGLVSGSAYAILAVCVVVLHRLVGVLNFGQAAIGAFGAFLCYVLIGGGSPIALAVLAGLGAAGAVAGGAGWVLARWFGDSGPLIRSVVTVVLLIVLLTLGFRLYGDTPRVMPSLFPEFSFAVAGVRVSLTTLVALVATFAIAVSLTALLKHTRVGIRLQAMSERPTSVQLLGINTRALSIGVWAITGALATFALLLVAPTRNPTFESMSFLVVPALAAGLLGAFSNVWIAALGGLALGALEGAGARIAAVAEFRGAIPFVIIIVAVIWMRRAEVWDAAR